MFSAADRAEHWKDLVMAVEALNPRRVGGNQRACIKVRTHAVLVFVMVIWGSLHEHRLSSHTTPRLTRMPWVLMSSWRRGEDSHTSHSTCYRSAGKVVYNNFDGLSYFDMKSSRDRMQKPCYIWTGPIIYIDIQRNGVEDMETFKLYFVSSPRRLP